MIYDKKKGIEKPVYTLKSNSKNQLAGDCKELRVLRSDDDSNGKYHYDALLEDEPVVSSLV